MMLQIFNSQQFLLPGVMYTPGLREYEAGMWQSITSDYAGQKSTFREKGPQNQPLTGIL